MRANWSRVFESKNVRIVAIEHNKVRAGLGACRTGKPRAAVPFGTMTRLYPIYHDLVAAALWDVACERATAPKAELLMLCRTEKEAAHPANLTGLGHGLKSMCDAKVAEREDKAGN